MHGSVPDGDHLKFPSFKPGEGVIDKKSPCYLLCTCQIGDVEGNLVPHFPVAPRTEPASGTHIGRNETKPSVFKAVVVTDYSSNRSRLTEQINLRSLFPASVSRVSAFHLLSFTSPSLRHLHRSSRRPGVSDQVDAIFSYLVLRQTPVPVLDSSTSAAYHLSSANHPEAVGIAREPSPTTLALAPRPQ